MKNFCLSFQKIASSEHTGDNLVEIINKSISNWPQVIAMIRDAGPNIKKASESLSFESLWCFAHFLNICLKDVRTDSDFFGSSVRKVVGHFNHSPKATQLLEEAIIYQEKTQNKVLPKRLIQDVETRWNSFYLCLERLLLLKSPLQHYWLDHSETPQLNESHWLIIEDLVPFLKIFYNITVFASSQQYPSLSLVLPMFRRLEQHCSTSYSNLKTPTAQKICSQISLSLGEKFRNVSKTLIMATILNPKYKFFPFFTAEQQKSFNECARTIYNENFKPNTTTNINLPNLNFGNSLDDEIFEFNKSFNKNKSDLQIFTEFSRYLESPALEKEVSVLDWWKENEVNFPHVAQLARKYLAIPASSCPCERLFSDAGQVVTKRRNRLAPETVEKIVFLHENKTFWF
jgi:hypothetical protein